MDPDSPRSPDEDTSGGCLYWGVVVFILAGLIWPLLHLLGHSYEPEILLIPLVVGGPSFILTHILALSSIARRRPLTSRGAQALKFLWGAVGVAVIVVVIAIAVEQVTQR